MKFNIKHISAVCFFTCISCISSAQNIIDSSLNVLPATSLKPFGRSFINKDHNLELISSAVHFGFTFKGKECTIDAFINDASGHNYLQYELDGVYQKRIKVMGGNVQTITITADADTTHTVWIYKATEAATGPIIIKKIEGNNLTVINIADEPTIEFIGNSITCGAAADTSETPCNQGVYHDHHNAYDAYGPRVARALNMNYILSSVSGIGLQNLEYG